jgi:hypothetical protein
MPECPICRRQYDEQSSVFVPPHPEAFDTIECAKFAAASWGAAAAPVILPTIEVVPAPPVAKPAVPAPPVAKPGRGIAALAVLALVPGQAALAGGVGLAAAGTAAAIYLAAKPTLAPHPEAAGTGSSQVPQTSTGGSTGGSPAVPAQGMPAARPPDAMRSGPRPSSRGAHAVVATAHLSQVTGGSSTRSSSRGGASQFISRTVPATQEPASTPQDSTPTGEQQTPPPRPTSLPKPKPKPTPQQPPATPAPPQPSTPDPPATPVPAPTGGIEDTGTRVLASTNSTPKPPKNQPPPVQPPPVPPPPVQTPPVEPPESGGSDDRPGNGWGDENHDHSGPPGHGDDGGHGDHGDSGHGHHH